MTDYPKESYKDLLAIYYQKEAELKELSYLLDKCAKTNTACDGDTLIKKTDEKLMSFIEETIEFLFKNFDECQQLEYLNQLRKSIKESFNSKQDSADKQAAYFKDIQTKFASL